MSTGGERTRTDRRTPYALAEQQRWSVVAVVTDSSVVVSSAAAASAVGGSGGCTIRLCWLDGGRNCCVCARQTQTAAGKWRTVIGEHRWPHSRTRRDRRAICCWTGFFPLYTSAFKNQKYRYSLLLLSLFLPIKTFDGHFLIVIDLYERGMSSIIKKIFCPVIPWVYECMSYKLKSENIIV